ncbi:MAG: hypothetical protein ABIP27_14470 [Flavobacterium circumlabens]|uniref:hypothetical protein n=1 Tax=Flavobacterium circumlabens TaxID=2133765 RepID=UPI0032632418
MKKLTYCFLFLMPLLAFSANPPPPGLPDEPVVVPIDSMLFLLATAGVVLGGYSSIKRK